MRQLRGEEWKKRIRHFYSCSLVWFRITKYYLKTNITWYQKSNQMEDKQYCFLLVNKRISLMCGSRDVYSHTCRPFTTPSLPYSTKTLLVRAIINYTLSSSSGLYPRHEANRQVGTVRRPINRFWKTDRQKSTHTLIHPHTFIHTHTWWICV